MLSQKASHVRIAHNEIHHFRYTGISTGWTWGYGPSYVSNVTVEYNHIHDIGLGYLTNLVDPQFIQYFVGEHLTFK